MSPPATGIRNHLGEGAKHRRERKQRSAARLLVSAVASAERLLTTHHSSNMGGHGQSRAGHRGAVGRSSANAANSNSSSCKEPRWWQCTCCDWKNNGHLERCSKRGCGERRAPNARVLPDKPPPKDRSQQRGRSQQRDRSQSRSRGQSARQQEQKPCPTTSSREMQLLRAEKQKVASLQKQLQDAQQAP